MEHACLCIIRCPIHAAAPAMLAEAIRIATVVQECNEKLDVMIQEVTDRWRMPVVTLDEAMRLLRSFEKDLDRYGELTIGTLQDFRATIETIDGEDEPRCDRDAASNIRDAERGLAYLEQIETPRLSGLSVVHDALKSILARVRRATRKDLV